MTPVSFAGTVGYLHEAPGDCLVVMAGAVGYEHLCTQRMWCELGDRIAAAGYPALRFDWAGCGDASGSDADPARCHAWEASLRDALAYARDRLGARRIAIVAMRHGALIAAKVAAEDQAIEAVALLAPPTSGRYHARELAALAQVIGTRPPPPGVKALPDGDFELAGFLVTAETQRDMGRYDLRTLGACPAASLLVVAQPEQSSTEAICSHLVSLGAHVRSGTFDGYQDLMVEPTFSKMPDLALGKVIEWLKQSVPLGTPAAPIVACGPALLAGDGFFEESVILTGEGPLVALWCRPNLGGRDAAVIFVSAGRTPHMGWARMNVEFARRLARDGITSLRIDIGGLGDSPPVAGRRAQVLYDDAPRRDIAVAVEALKRAGFTRITLVGLCSGAHLAFHTAVEHEEVTGLVLVNLQKFIWRTSDRLEIVLRNTFRSNKYYKSEIWRRATWLRLMRGDIHFAGIARAVSKRFARTLRNRAASAGRGIGLVDDDTAKVQRWFRSLSARNVRGLVVYSAEDGGLDELTLHMGSQAHLLTRLPGMSLSIIEGADHNMTPAWSRRQLCDELRAFLMADAASADVPVPQAAQ